MTKREARTLAMLINVLEVSHIDMRRKRLGTPEWYRALAAQYRATAELVRFGVPMMIATSGADGLERDAVDSEHAADIIESRARVA